MTPAQVARVLLCAVVSLHKALACLSTDTTSSAWWEVVEHLRRAALAADVALQTGAPAGPHHEGATVSIPNPAELESRVTVLSNTAVKVFLYQ